MKYNRLKFNPKLHAYLLDDKPITGVTTILKVIAKPFLIPWAANMAVDYIKGKTPFYLSKEEELIIINLDNFNKALQEAREAHTQKRDKAGDIGKEAHKLCENWIKSKDGNVKKSKSPQVNKMVRNFCEWANKNKVKFIASEKKVFSEKYWFCGTYDFLCEIDKKIWLGDIKTGSGIYPDMFFQTAGYQICEEEMNPKLKIDGHIIVNIKKNGTLLEKRSISNKDNKEAFLSALTLYRIMSKVEGNTL